MELEVWRALASKAAGLERGGAGFSPRLRERACQVPLTRQGGDALNPLRVEAPKTNTIRSIFVIPIRRSNNAESFFLGSETNSKGECKRKKKLFFFMNMEIVTNFEVVKLGHRIVML